MLLLVVVFIKILKGTGRISLPITFTTIIIDKNSKLAEIYGLETSINSFHHQSIKHLASDLRVIARDPEDNTVEAIESNTPDLRYLGVQWHPELLLHKREEDLKLFEYVVNEL